MRDKLTIRQRLVLENLANVADRGSDGAIYACTYKLRPDGMSTAQTYQVLRQLRRDGLAQPHPHTLAAVWLWGITPSGRALIQGKEGRSDA